MATALTPLTLRLTRARFAARQGESTIYFAGVLAYTVTTMLAMIIAGGTWMFYQRATSPTGLHAEVLEADSSYQTVFNFYIALAAIACAMLIPALVNLASGAAVLGARGRERRLAVLRLIGVSGTGVTRMSVLDALIQYAIGLVIGTALYLASLPAWGLLSVQAKDIEPQEMLIPWWLMIAVALVVLAICLLATWRGLRMVKITPLGVSRRAPKPGLSWIRFAVFIVIVVGAVVAVNIFQPGTDMLPFLIFAGVIMVLIYGINLVSPWFLQIGARLVAQTPAASIKWAARRIVADPVATWRRVSGVSVLSFVGGYMALTPIRLAVPPEASDTITAFTQGAQWDFTKGVIVTLVIGFILTATSMFITQASATIERGEQSRSLQMMGAPTGFSLKVMWLETYAPLLLATVLGAGLGSLMALPMYLWAKDFGFSMDDSVLIVAAVISAGLILAAVSLLASHPIYRRTLVTTQRRND